MKGDDRGLEVLYVINSLGAGGAERSLADLLDPLSERGIRMSIACLERTNEGVEAEVSSKHPVHFVGGGLGGLLRLRGLLERAVPDLVHTTIFEADIMGRLAAFAGPTPVVTSIVNSSYAARSAGHGDLSPLKLGIVRLVDAVSLRLATRGVHVLTDASARYVRRYLGYPSRRITVIPRGRDLSRLGEPSRERRLEARRSLGISDDRPVILSVGRREHQKGQIHAIDAVGILKTTHPDLLLLVAGRDGAASGALEARAQRDDAAGAVRFLGHRTDVPHLMAASDLLVFPSLYEGFGGTVIEAMALGLPMVVADIEVLREVAGDAALYATPRSGADLAEKVKALLDEPMLRERLATRGRSRFRSEYELGEVADRMADWYRKMAFS